MIKVIGTPARIKQSISNLLAEDHKIISMGGDHSLTQVGIRTLTAHQQEPAKKIGVIIIEMKDFNNDFIKKLSSPLYISSEK